MPHRKDDFSELREFLQKSRKRNFMPDCATETCYRLATIQGKCYHCHKLEKDAHA